MEWVESLASRVGTECGLLTLVFFGALVGFYLYHRREIAYYRAEANALRLIIQDDVKRLWRFMDTALPPHERRREREEP